MNPKPVKTPVGCLCIGDLLSGTSKAPGQFLFPEGEGLAAMHFDGGQGDLWEGLQTALHRLRQRCETATVAARGVGCAAALALAEQLPVERLALVEPVLTPAGGADRQLRRLAAFARRNLSLCASDILVVGSADRSLREDRLSAHCRLARLRWDRENDLKAAIARFLVGGDMEKIPGFP